MAFDQRFAMALIGSSGKGGAKLLRRNFGEAVESLTGGGYYWMAGNFMKYGAAEARFGSKNAGRYAGRFQLTDSALCAAPHLYQLRYPGERRCQVARPPGKLHGDRGRKPRLSSCLV